MKKIIVVAILLAIVTYGGTKIFTSNQNQLAQVTGSVQTTVTASSYTIQQGQNFTVTITTPSPITDTEGLYVEALGTNRQIYLTKTGGSGNTAVFSAQMPATHPVGIFEWSTFATPGHTGPSQYFSTNLTVTAAAGASATDSIAPAISGVTVSNINQTSAVISWATNEPADGMVEYGVSGSAQSIQFSKTDSTITTSHSVTLTGLIANTAYIFYVKSSDRSGNSVRTTSAVTFRTTQVPTVNIPVVTGPITNIRSRHEGGVVTISWNTDKPTHGFVDYGLTTNYGKTKKTQDRGSVTRTTEHAVRILGIIPNTTYHFKIRTDAADGTKSVSEDNVFKSDTNGGGFGIGSPNPDVIWQNGNSERIWWGSNYENLPIDIYLAGGNLTVPIKLKSSVASHDAWGPNVPRFSGMETVKVPSVTAAPPGNNYYILIKINNVEVIKSRIFEIKANKGPITVNLPTTTFKKNVPYTITWNRQDDLYSPPFLNVMLTGGTYGNTGINIGNNTGNRTAPIIIGKDVPVGKYKITLKQFGTNGVRFWVNVAESAEISVVE